MVEVDSAEMVIPLMMVYPVILKNDAKLTNQNNVLLGRSIFENSNGNITSMK